MGCVISFNIFGPSLTQVFATRVQTLGPFPENFIRRILLVKIIQRITQNLSVGKLSNPLDNFLIRRITFRSSG